MSEWVDVTGFTLDGRREYLPCSGPASPVRRRSSWKPTTPPSDRAGEMLNLAISALFLALVMLPVVAVVWGHS